MTPHGNISSQSKLRVVSWYNDSGEECPGHGIIEVTDIERDDDSGDDVVLIGTKPTRTTTCIAVNLESPVPDGEYGFCCIEFPTYAAWDTDSGTPGNGETWGPEADSWVLHFGRPGFKVLGNAVNGVVAVVPEGLPASNRKKFRLIGDLSSRLTYYNVRNVADTEEVENPFSVLAVPQRWSDDAIDGALFPGLGTTGDTIYGAWVAESYVDAGSSGTPSTETLYFNSTFIGYLFGNVDGEGDQSDTVPNMTVDCRGGNGWLVEAQYDDESGKWFVVGTGMQTVWGEVSVAAGIYGIVTLQEVAPADSSPSYTRNIPVYFPSGGVAEGDKVQCTWQPCGDIYGDTLGTWIAIKVSDVSDFTSGCCILIGDDGAINFVATDAAGPGLTTTSDPCKKLKADLGCGLKFDGNKISANNEDLQGVGIVPSGSGCGLDIYLIEGCGIVISSGNTISFFADDAAGAGLVTVDSCTLNVGEGPGISVTANDVRVNYGCGLYIVGGALEFDAATVADDGLEDVAGCGLKVKPHCFITVGASGVSVDTPKLVGDGSGYGLTTYTGTGGCDFIGVDNGCYLTFDGNALTLNLTELVGSGLEIGTDEPCHKIKAKVGCGLHITASGIEVTVDELAGYGLIVDTSGDCDKFEIDPTIVPSGEYCCEWMYCAGDFTLIFRGASTGAWCDSNKPTAYAGQESGDVRKKCMCDSKPPDETPASCPGTMVSDLFTDTDGTALTAHTPNITPGDTWHVDSGTWDIQSNKARQSDGPSVERRAYIDSTVSGVSGHPVTVSANVTIANYTTGSLSPGLIFRYSDSTHYWRLAPDAVAGTVYLIQDNATVRATASVSLPAGTYAVSAVLSGTSISCSYAGASLSYTSSANQSNTKHGLTDYYDPTTGGDTTRNTFDNFLVTCT